VAASALVVLYVLQDAALAAEPKLDLSEISPSEYRERLNDATVTIVVGAPNATGLDVAYDLAGVLDDETSLRIVPIIGKGVAQNVRDVRFMRGVDMGLTHANILAHFSRTGELGRNIISQITYVAKLFNEEVHLLVRSEIKNIKELEGKRVSFGEEGSGTDITAALILEALSIDVQPVYLSAADAIKQLTSGELDAAIVIGGKPAPLMTAIQQAKGLKLIPIPYESHLEDDYYPATLSHQDYPDLIPPGDSVETVAVCAVLITFNWTKDSERYRKVEKFVDAFFTKFQEFHRPPHHPKWREVNFAATLEGWTRSPIAQRWIDQSERPNMLQVEFDQFLRQQSARSDNHMSVTERTELFREFVEWSSKGKSPAGGQQ
jgi:TRAP transporter TAXI family solute receptor